MRTDARDRTIAHFEAFLHGPSTRSFTPVLVHGDFGASNIIYDAARRTVTGIIDFSSAGPDDPAVDLAAAATIAPGILTYILANYPDARRAYGRVAFYMGTFALQEALFGIENGDDEAFRSGMEGYM